MSASNFSNFDASEAEIILREAREGNPKAQALLAKPEPFAKVIPSPSETKDERRRRLTYEHHLRIESGEIDIGPLPDTHVPSVDARDLRDPSALGKAVLSHAESTPVCAYASYLDAGNGFHIPNYDPGESRATFTARKYREELEWRAAQGDKFAISVLMTGQPGDSGE